jgi:putative RNA 2'-phosphotransferase
VEAKRLVRVSKFLSRHLRHSPERIGIALDSQGWVAIDALLDAASRHGVAISRTELDEIVARNDKARFAIDGDRIRASQGHSVAVDLGLEPLTPPSWLFHGTVGRVLAAIREEGLRPMRRHHVHLSADRETSVKVGSRRGAPVVLSVDSGRMHAEGVMFYRSDNGVWLVDAVPPRFIAFPER